MTALPKERRSTEPRSELERQAWPKLTAEMVEQLRRVGSELEVEAGEVLFEVGQESYDLIYLERGSARIVDRAGDHVVVTIEAPNFLGELGMLMGQGTFLAGIAAEPTRIVRVDRERVRELMATVPEINDVLVTAFAARRRLLIEWGEGGLTIVGRESDADCMRLREFASRNRIPYRFVDRSEIEAVAELATQCDLPESGTAVITGRFEVLAGPTPLELARALGMDLDVEKDELFDLLVIGGGPGGLAAAVYGASEGLCTLVVDDTAIGGQAGTSSRIENYLGFSTGISGTELAHEGEIQALKFGARIAVPRRATGLREEGGHFVVNLDDGSQSRARAVVLANGVRYRRLPLDRLEEFEGVGVYYAATHLEARLTVGTEAVIVGGGNSAGQAAMFLSRHARCTHVVVRRAGLAATMSSYLAERILNDERIRLWTHTEVSELSGEDRLEAVVLRDLRTGEESRIPAGALFVMIGAEPNTDWLRGTVDLDDHGFVVTGRDAETFQTSIPGVFAVGDIRSGSIKRVASAVGEGSVVVSSVHRFLDRSDG